MSKTRSAPTAFRVEPWVKVPRALLSSDAWRSLGINGRRFIDFLLLEHMGKAGTQNGKLKAPYRQLEAFGISTRHISAAIHEVESLGLVSCSRNGLRSANTYTLTWLPSPGAPASDFWRGYRNPSLGPLPGAKRKNLPSDGKVWVPSEGKADGANLPSEGRADRPKSLPSEGKALLRKDLTRAGGVSQEERGGVVSVPVAAPRSPAPGKFRVISGGGGHE
jgi:hypothetical protein